LQNSNLNPLQSICQCKTPKQFLLQVNKALNDVLREGSSRVKRAAAAGSDEADVVKAQRWCARMAQHRDTAKECRAELGDLAL
jgi:hypothetical protein